MVFAASLCTSPVKTAREAGAGWFAFILWHIRSPGVPGIPSSEDDGVIVAFGRLVERFLTTSRGVHGVA